MHRLLSILLATLILAGAVPGPAVAQDTVQLHDGATYWQGQTLERGDGIPNGATVAVRATTHQHYREYSAGRDGTITFDTSDYGPGTYSLRVQGEEVARFHIEVQSLTMATETVDPDTGHANFTVQTPRAQFDLVVNSSSLTTTELEHIFEDYTTTETDVDDDSRDELVIRDVRRSQPLQGDFANHRGTHTLHFDVLDTGAAAKAKVEVGWPQYQQVALLDDQLVDHHGDIVPIRIALSKTDTARLNIGSPKVNYVLNATVRDTNGDNRVTVYLHTPEMGQPERALSADSGTVSVLNETQLSGTADPAEYPVAVVDQNGNHDDVATLNLQHGESKQAYSYSYPRGEHPASMLGVQDGVRDAVVVDNESIALVYQVSGIYSTLEDADAGDLANGIHGIQLEIVGERQMNANERPTLDVDEGDLIVKPEAEMFALVLDTEAVQATPGSEYNATLRFKGRDLEPLSTAFTVESPEVSFERPLPAAQTAIRGQTNYEPGSTVSLEIYGRDGAIQQSRTLEVGESGGFSAPVDVRTLAGESLSVQLASVGEWRELPVREDAATMTTQKTTVQTTAAATTPASTTAQQGETVRETTTTAAVQTTFIPSNATTTTAGQNQTLAATTSAPNPESGLLSGLWSILGWGVLVVGGGLVLVNRIAD